MSDNTEITSLEDTSIQTNTEITSLEDTSIQTNTEEPTVTSVIRLDDLQNEYNVLVQRETTFGNFLTTNILGLDINTLKRILISWAAVGYPDMYRILPIYVDLPDKCSDGVVRDVYEYIEFCANISLTDILNSIQQKLDGIKVNYITEGRTITIIVSKA